MVVFFQRLKNFFTLEKLKSVADIYAKIILYFPFVKGKDICDFCPVKRELPFQAFGNDDFGAVAVEVVAVEFERSRVGLDDLFVIK